MVGNWIAKAAIAVMLDRLICMPLRTCPTIG
jgi:hypothetical protein